MNSSRVSAGKRRRADIDAEHVPKPGVLADALMHHVLVHAASARVVLPGRTARSSSLNSLQTLRTLTRSVS